MNPRDVVIIRCREGAVPAKTSHLAWECFVNGKLLGYFESYADAATAAQNHNGAA